MEASFCGSFRIDIIVPMQALLIVVNLMKIFFEAFSFFNTFLTSGGGGHKMADNVIISMG